MKVKFKEWDCILRQGLKYDNGRIALLLNDEFDGQPIATASVNMADVETAYPDEIFIKEYSENEGMTEALIGAGVINPDPVQTVRTGFVIVKSYKLTEEAYEYLTTK